MRDLKGVRWASGVCPVQVRPASVAGEFDRSSKQLTNSYRSAANEVRQALAEMQASIQNATATAKRAANDLTQTFLREYKWSVLALCSAALAVGFALGILYYGLARTGKILRAALVSSGRSVWDFFNRAHRGSHRQHPATTLFEAALQLLQRSGFPGACRPANVHRQVMRIENKFDCLFLLGTEELGSSEFILPAQSLKLTNPAIDPLDHVPLTVKTLACGDFLPSPRDATLDKLLAQALTEFGRNYCGTDALGDFCWQLLQPEYNPDEPLRLQRNQRTKE